MKHFDADFKVCEARGGPPPLAHIAFAIFADNLDTFSHDQHLMSPVMQDESQHETWQIKQGMRVCWDIRGGGGDLLCTQRIITVIIWNFSF